MTRALVLGQASDLAAATLAAFRSLEIPAVSHTWTDEPRALSELAETRSWDGISLLVTVLSPQVAVPIGRLDPGAWDASIQHGLRDIAFAAESFALQVPPPSRDAVGEMRAAGHVIHLIDHPLDLAMPSDASAAISAQGLASLTRIAAVQFAPQVRVNAIAPAPRRAKRDAIHVVPALGSAQARLPRDPATLSRSLAHLIDQDAMTGQIVFLQSRN